MIQPSVFSLTFGMPSKSSPNFYPHLFRIRKCEWDLFGNHAGDCMEVVALFSINPGRSSEVLICGHLYCEHPILRNMSQVRRRLRTLNFEEQTFSREHSHEWTGLTWELTLLCAGGLTRDLLRSFLTWIILSFSGMLCTNTGGGLNISIWRKKSCTVNDL